MKHAFRQIPFHVLLFPSFTILALASNNLGQIQLGVIWRPLLVSVFLSIAIILFTILFFRNLNKAGIFTLSVLLFGLTYGHFFDMMKDRVIGGWVIGTHFYMLLLWGVFFLGFTYLLIWKIRSIKSVTLIFNIVMCVMTLFQIFRITIYEVNVHISDKKHETPVEETLLKPGKYNEMPDVYYIILDKYARSDVIKRVYDYDNSEFVQELEDLGFFVPKCSRSNYAFTVMSLSSQLNMAFVEDLTDEPSLKTTTSLIKSNLVHQAFSEIGYTTIAFDMGFSWGNMKGSNYYFDDYPNEYEISSLTPFEILYLKSTLGILIFDNHIDLGAQITLSDLERKAERTLLILDILPEIPKMTGPKFVHAHLVCPHPPYIFNADGSLNPNAEDIKAAKGYPEQLAFLEPRLLEIVRHIIEESLVPPIIILEGDHGFGKTYVTSNFMALYLPGDGDEGLGENMTMINVFPNIFNTYFGTDLEYLPDICYTHTDNWYESVIQEEWNPACLGE